MNDFIAKWLGPPASVRADLAAAGDASTRARQKLVLSSLVGVLSMTPVVLLQTGVVRHLPDPPWWRFDSDRVNRSRDAFRFRVPDGALALAGFALNIPLAAAGDRGRTPWISVLAMAKTGIEAVVAAWYFSLMPRKQKRWCAYCVVGAAASALAFGSALPEGLRAIGRIGRTR